MKEQLIARWDTFLRNIDKRFEESLAHGEQAVLESLEENYDYYTSFRTLMAIRMQIDESVIRKIDTTWQQQVLPLMQADGGHYWADESHKGYHASDAMHERMQLWLYITEGKLSQKYYDHAIELINRDFFCTQCNAPLQVKKDLFRAHYITCNYCSAVNTFEPETKYATIGWNVVDNLAALYALQEYKAMLQARKNGGDVYPKAVRAYCEKYFDERIKLMPHTADTREQDIEKKVNLTL
ncbi:hypothetical protein [Chitinophaga sp. GbtcB8]|uniref:hypothetical protein n=1 Tax=Chitinophaga sp. GbtcB8 TaxID=2824753 RepID=UPI001C2F4616|nr:hypothetical protein [Chitinophaga sp. GbtcB8]